MIVRGGALVLVVTALAGCANDGMPRIGQGFAAHDIVAATGSVTAPVATGDRDGDMVPRKTVASRVLAAIALEKVTGRTPDPARLSQAQ